jgi:acyl-[acyl-carrier-protein] desaturase
MDRDPERALLVFRNMMKRVIAMPGRLMCDGHDRNLFENFATVAERLGVYTAHEYARIIGHLVSTWNVATRSVSGKAAAAQDFLCVRAERLAALADAVAEHVLKQPPVRFSWLHGRME